MATMILSVFKDNKPLFYMDLSEHLDTHEIDKLSRLQANLLNIYGKEDIPKLKYYNNTLYYRDNLLRWFDALG
jgi:hypothetical protein